ncbi:MAG: alpha/beta hydrolase [Acidobacteriota bacterium]
MAAQRHDEEEVRRRRNQLVRGLLLGGAAVGVPALINAFVDRRNASLPLVSWGRGTTWTWRDRACTLRRLGDGPPIVLLHSLGPGHHAHEWRRVAERLATSHEVLVPDLPGWGSSPAPPGRPRPRLYIDFLSQLLDDLVDQPVVLAAAGRSAAYAVQLAVDRPSLIRALALVGPRGLESTAQDPPSWRDYLLYGLLRTPVLGVSALNVLTSRSAITRYVRRHVYGEPSIASEALIESVYHCAHRPEGRAALAAQLAGLLDHGVGSILAATEQPLWLAWGRRSLAPPVETADLWLRERPDVTLEVIERSGLLPHAESPVELSQKLEDFLRRLDS